MCPAETDLIAVGKIIGAHGIRGELVVKTYTAEAGSIAAYGTLFDETGAREFTVIQSRPAKKGTILRLNEISTRNDAESLKGRELFISRGALPPAEENSYYYADLIGLEAIDVGGQKIGIVVAVQNFGAGDLLEIRREGQAETDLVPLTEEFVPSIELEHGRVVIDPADGLFE